MSAVAEGASVVDTEELVDVRAGRAGRVDVSKQFLGRIQNRPKSASGCDSGCPGGVECYDPYLDECRCGISCHNAANTCCWYGDGKCCGDGNASCEIFECKPYP